MLSTALFVLIVGALLGITLFGVLPVSFPLSIDLTRVNNLLFYAFTPLFCSTILSKIIFLMDYLLLPDSGC
jgi:hypothetical protein